MFVTCQTAIMFDTSRPVKIPRRLRRQANTKKRILLLLFIPLILYSLAHIYLNRYPNEKPCSSVTTNPTVKITKDWYKQTIYNKWKANPNMPLHELDILPFESVEEWDYYVKGYVRPLHIQDGYSIFESGCGVGAFLDSLRRQYKNLKVAGVDFTEMMIEIAQQRMPDGTFWVGDITKPIDFVASDTYDVSVSFSVFNYLENEEKVLVALKEMVRVTKPGGAVYIGNINDLAKKDIAPCFTSSLFLPKSFWYQAAQSLGMVNVQIIDEYDINHKNYDWKFSLGFDGRSRYRYSVYMWKPLSIGL